MNLRVIRESWQALWAVAEMTFRHQVMDTFIVFAVFVQPLLIALLALWMLQGKGSEFAIFVVVGSGMTGLWSSLLFVSGNSVNAERWMGTLETLVGVPTPLQVIVFGKNLASVAQSLGSMVVSYATAALLFGYTLQIDQPILFAVSLVFTVVSFISFGLIIAPVFVMNPSVQQWQNALEFPIYILAGFLFPIALLPGWTTPLSYLLPPYWAARALHGASSGGASLEEILFSWLMMFVFTVIYFVIAGKLFDKMLVKARTDATLDME